MLSGVACSQILCMFSKARLVVIWCNWHSIVLKVLMSHCSWRDQKNSRFSLPLPKCFYFFYLFKSPERSSDLHGLQSWCVHNTGTQAYCAVPDCHSCWNWKVGERLRKSPPSTLKIGQKTVLYFPLSQRSKTLVQKKNSDTLWSRRKAQKKAKQSKEMNINMKKIHFIAKLSQGINVSIICVIHNAFVLVHISGAWQFGWREGHFFELRTPLWMSELLCRLQGGKCSVSWSLAVTLAGAATQLQWRFFFFPKITAGPSLKCHQIPPELITFQSEGKEPLSKAPCHCEDFALLDSKKFWLYSFYLEIKLEALCRLSRLKGVISRYNGVRWSEGDGDLWVFWIE